MLCFDLGSLNTFYKNNFLTDFSVRSFFTQKNVFYLQRIYTKLWDYETVLLVLLLKWFMTMILFYHCYYNLYWLTLVMTILGHHFSQVIHYIVDLYPYFHLLLLGTLPVLYLIIITCTIVLCFYWNFSGIGLYGKNKEKQSEVKYVYIWDWQ